MEFPGSDIMEGKRSCLVALTMTSFKHDSKKSLELLEILKMRIAEHRREEIAANAREVLQAVGEKRAKFGTVEDLKRDLLED